MISMKLGKMSLSGIYIIRNLESRKVYVGSAVNIKQRWWQHRTGLRGGYHKNPHLRHSFNKYGESAFEFKVLAQCDRADLIRLEQKAIDVYRGALGWDMMYNMSPIAGSSLGIKHSLEARNNMSTAAKKRVTPEWKARMSAINVGKRFSPEHKAKISKAGMGRKLSPEHCAKMSAARKGKPGKKHSPETRAKISAALQGNKNTLGYKYTLEAKANTKAAAIRREAKKRAARQGDKKT